MHPTALVGAAAALSVERLAYIWICRRPQAFEYSVFRLPLIGGGGPTGAVARLFAGFKVVQVAVFAWWCWLHGGLSFVEHGIHPAALGAAVALIAGGQLLNASVFLRLGANGVFYGDRFGMTLPWRTEFPFSVLSHPQYVGTCLSIWGLFLLARFPQPDWYAIPVLETVYYIAGARLER